MEKKNILRGILLLAIGMAIIAWSPKPAMATTWHVFPGESIDNAIDNASPGDTVFVHAGTYYGAISVHTPNITVKGEGADVVTWDGEGSEAIDVYADASGFVIGGLTIKNSYAFSISSNASDCIIRNCVFEGIIHQYGVSIGSNNATFRDNVVKDSPGAYGAVQPLGDSCTIVNNTIIDNVGAGILLYPSTAANHTITKNNISSNGKGFFLYNAGEGNKIYLNDIVANTASVAYGGTPPTTTYWNSTSQIVYVYNGTTYTNYLGNYWGSDYTGTDADGDGIGDTPYPIPSSATDCDSFPLMQQWEDYQIPDFNLNGYVDAADLQLFGDHWHFTATDSLTWDAIYNLEHTPVGGYQYIDAGDLQVFGDHWHEGTPPRSGQGGKSGKGPNEFAGIVFDLATELGQSGNDGVTSIPSQPAETYIRVDVYCTGVNNLDTYEFEVIYDPTELAYVTATPTNPITFEGNILESNGGTALGWMIDTSTPGVLSIAYTLAGTDPAQAPEGEGLIADIVFQALVATHGTLSFGDVYFYDSYGVVDLITDTGTATLPVELAAFTATYVAENGYTSIYWATASETDVNGFNVYRNTDDDFGTAMRINYDLIPGYGTTSEPKDYTFIDDNPVVFETTYYYWLESIDLGGETHVYASISLTPEEGEGGFVNDFKENRLGNHPNPFKGFTTIEYAIKGRLKAEPVDIRIYNVAGQLVETIEARYGTAVWNFDSLPTGVYFYQLKTENYNEVKKMLLIR